LVQDDQTSRRSYRCRQDRVDVLQQKIAIAPDLTLQAYDLDGCDLLVVWKVDWNQS
jgi:hypothetical protein